MRTIAFVLGCILSTGCASSASQPAASPAQATAAAKPDRDQTILHLQRHVEYPASRTKVLAACANTPEFNEAEKKWFTDNLPEGNYASADEVMKALHL
jgi:hypothetical protein